MEFFTLQTANKADLYRKKELRLTDSIIQTQSVLNVTFFGHREKKKKQVNTIVAKTARDF